MSAGNYTRSTEEERLIETVAAARGLCDGVEGVAEQGALLERELRGACRELRRRYQQVLHEACDAGVPRLYMGQYPRELAEIEARLRSIRGEVDSYLRRHGLNIFPPALLLRAEGDAVEQAALGEEGRP